jgi:nitrogen regulatory protein P-II 1
MNDTIKMKRFEIVIGIEQLDQLMELLKRCEVRNYTLIKNVGGYGSRGVRNPDDVLIADENALIILACKEDQAHKILSEIVPARKALSGMCIISDCQWVQQLTV